MMLRLLYDLAKSRNLLADLAFSPKAVRWIIDIDLAGNLVGLGLQSTGDDKRGKEFLCPQTTRNKLGGGVAEFLADGLTALFGLDPSPEAEMPEKRRADRKKNNERKCEDFWRQLQEIFDQIQSDEVKAVLSFHHKAGSPPSFLRWAKQSGTASGEKAAWWVRNASGSETRLGADVFTFRIRGNLLLEDDQIRNYWRKLHAQEVQAARSRFPRGLCLITEKNEQPLAATHNPKIQGVPNTQSFGAALVSFDKPSFGSYGFDQSLNAPTSDEAATAYCTALNWLLDREDHHIRLGQTALCFWAAESESSSGLIAKLLNRPDPQSIAQFMKSPWAGISRDLARRDKFIAVTLGGNAGRIVVRHWLQSSLEQAVENFCRWFNDLELMAPAIPQTRSRKREEATDKESMPPLAIFRLACTTVREAKDLMPDVPAQLYRAALECSPPSALMLKPILDQLRSKLVTRPKLAKDKKYQPLYDVSRFALLRLILNRNRKENTMMIYSKLTADTDDAAYNCGRLLAVLAAAQDKAHDYKLEGPGVTERYFGTASVSPASVFPLLLRLNRHHLNKISKSERFAGDERFLEEQIWGVLALFRSAMEGQSPTFPRTLDLQSQGRFALGFYQQMAQDHASRQAALAEKQARTNNK